MNVASLLLSAPTQAAGADVSGFFTWESIGSFSGAVALVVFVVQLLKLPLDRVWKIPTQYVVYFISLFVLLLAQAFALGGLSAQTALLCVLNAAVVALSAMSAYDVAIGRVESEKNRDAG